MPWTVRDVSRFKSGLDAEQKRQWVATANDVLSRCLADGGQQANCEASAIRQANAAVGAPANQEAHIHHYKTPTKNYEIRHEVHQGRRHLVVPIVMMVEGVHHGSHGPLLHLAEDLGRFVAAWNDIPVSVEHPEQDGMNVSAGDPDIIERQVVGRIYRAMMDGGRLRAEAWLDELALRRVSPEALRYIVEGRPLDVSVGVFTEEEFASGDWNGERYDAIARNHRPDHLALLPGGTGACSWADGCGVRINKQGDVDMGHEEIKTHAIRYSGTESTAWSAPNLGDFDVGSARWEDLSAADRSRVASHYLVGTGSMDFADLKFPVVNPRNGRLNERALRAVIGGRGAQADIPAAQRTTARRAAYRLLNDEFDAGLEVPDTLAAQAKELALEEGLALAVHQMGHLELAKTIQAKLDRMDTDTKLHFLVDVFDDDFIYRVEGRGGDMPHPSEGGEHYRRTYEVNDDDTVEFTGEPVAVTKKVEYVAMNETREGGIMAKEIKDHQETTPCCPEKVEMLIQNELTSFGEDDREVLSAMEEAVIDKMLADADKAQGDIAALKADVEQLKADAEKKGEAAAEGGEPQMNKEQAIQVLKANPMDRKEFLGLVDSETREQLEYGLKAYRDERQRLVDHIKGNSAEAVYTDEELTAMSMGDLEKLARAIKTRQDYSMQGPTAHEQRKSYGEALLPPGVTAS